MNIPECCTHCKTMQKHNCIFQESCVTVRRFLRKQYDSMMIEYSIDTHWEAEKQAWQIIKRAAQERQFLTRQTERTYL